MKAFRRSDLNSTASPFVRKMASVMTLSDAELVAMTALQSRRRTFPTGSDIASPARPSQLAYVIAEGWVCSYRLLRDGSRQIIDFRLPGDVFNLRAALTSAVDHTIQPMTTVIAAEIDRGELLTGIAGSDRLAEAFNWSMARDEAILVEHLVNVGRRGPLERTVHLLLELGARLQLVGLADTTGYACPLSQALVSDALGLSAVHLNRVLRELREDDLLTFQRGRVTFHDLGRLVAFAGFDGAYLNQDGPVGG